MKNKKIKPTTAAKITRDEEEKVIIAPIQVEVKMVPSEVKTECVLTSTPGSFSPLNPEPLYKPACCKCGSSDTFTRWHRDHRDCDFQQRQWCTTLPMTEHLHYHCRNCGYGWTGPVLMEKLKKA